MRAKAHSGLYGIVIKYAKHAKIHALGVVVIGKTEGVVRIQPAMIGMATCIGFVKYGVVHDLVVGVR